MEHLVKELDILVGRLKKSQEFRQSLQELVSVYPFNEFEYVITHLMAARKLTLDEYYELRNSYIERNLYLYLFEISAPRGFGEVWAHAHLRELVPTLRLGSRKLDPSYRGQYDLFLPPDIRIEVKASRAVEFNRDAPLHVKALASDSSKPFDMNFQQLKPACCDVFVWVAVWRDVIRYWVLPSHDVETSRYYSPGQHRGNVGEGQLHLNQDNIQDFDGYLAVPRDVEEAIRRAFRQNHRAK